MMSDVIEDQALLNIVNEILEEVIRNEEFKGCQTNIKLIPCTCRNYTGAIYSITLKHEDRRTLNLFAKIANATKYVRQFMPVIEMYNREKFLYKDLAHIYEDIQNKYRVPEEEKFKFPKYYASNGTVMAEGIILENLSAKQYNVADRFKPMDWDYAAKAVKELAKFHALSFTLEKESPKLFNDTVTDKHEFVNVNENVSDGDRKKYRTRLFINLLESLPQENAEKMKVFMGKVSKELWHEQFKVQRRPVLCHGDYRHSNLMTKYEEEKIVDLIPVDYQTVYYGSPINDLMYFIFTGSDEEFRKEHYDSLLQHYHKCLTNFLELLGYDVNDIYPIEEYELDVKERTMYGLLLSLFILPYILVEEKPDFNQKIGDLSIKRGDIFNERFNGIVNDYVKWGYI